jgi:hypothetical protein
VRLPVGRKAIGTNATLMEPGKAYKVIGSGYIDSVNIECGRGYGGKLNLAEGHSLKYVEKCAAPIVEKPARVTTAHEVECACGDGATLTINFDPNGAADGGPCVDFDITDAVNDIVEIEDLQVLDELVMKLQDVRRDFKRAQVLHSPVKF